MVGRFRRKLPPVTTNERDIERWLREQGLSPWGSPAEELQRGG